MATRPLAPDRLCFLPRMKLLLFLAAGGLLLAGRSPGAAEPASPPPAWKLPLVIDRGDDVSAWTRRHQVPEIVRADLAAAQSDGRPALRFDYDLGKLSGTYIYRFGPPLNRDDVLSLEFKADAIGRFQFCLQDATGQDHRGFVSVKPEAGWQTVELPLATGFAQGHWNGANDGVIHYPCGRISLTFDQSAPRGTFWLRRLSLRSRAPTPERTWRLSLNGSQPAGVVFPGEKVVCRVRIENLVDAPRAGELTLNLRRTDGQAEERRWPFQVGPLGQVELPVQEFTAGEPEFRHFHARVSENCAAGGELQGALAVVRRVPNQGRPDPESFFGLMNAYQSPEGVERIGCKSFREWIWVDPQSRRVVDSWRREIDQQLIPLGRCGIAAVLCLQPNAWHGVRPGDARYFPPAEMLQPQRLAEWRAMARLVAERYRGQLAAIELVNEPDNELWHNPDYPLEPARQLYAALVNAAAAEIRAVDPQLPIVALSVAGRDFHPLNGVPTPQCPGDFTFSRAVLPLIKGNLDLYGGHPYGHVRILGRNRQAQWPEEMHLRELLLQASDLLEQNGCPRRLWPTELGWSVIDPVDPPDELSRRFAAVVGQSLVLAKTVPGLEKLFWFNAHAHNSSGDDYSLFHCNTAAKVAPIQCPELFPTPAACAYAAAAYQLHHARFIEPVPLGADFSAWRFERPGDGAVVVALWARADGEFRLNFTGPAATVYDSYDRRLAAGGRLTADFGRAPVFLTAAEADGPALAQALARAEFTALEPVRIAKVWFHSRTEARALLDDTLHAPVTSRLGFAGQTETRELRPGRQSVGWTLPAPLSGAAPELAVTTNGFTKTATPCTDFWPARRLAAVAADGDLKETAGLEPIVLADRTSLMPPDAAWDGPEDLSATAWLGWTESGLYFAARVTDDRHQGTPDDPQHYWQADSLQLAIDPEGDSLDEYNADDREVGLVLGPNGPRAYLHVRGKKLNPLACALAARREAQATIYEALLPWAALEIAPPAGGRIMALSFIVNENDGQGRDCWLAWTPGVGESKAPVNYRQVRFDP